MQMLLVYVTTFIVGNNICILSCKTLFITPSIPVLRAHFANLLAQGYLSLALILLFFSFIRALAHALVVCMRYVFIHAHALEHAK
jgi:hypothetical protein